MSPTRAVILIDTHRRDSSPNLAGKAPPMLQAKTLPMWTSGRKTEGRSDGDGVEVSSLSKAGTSAPRKASFEDASHPWAVELSDNELSVNFP